MDRGKKGKRMHKKRWVVNAHVLPIHFPSANSPALILSKNSGVSLPKNRLNSDKFGYDRARHLRIGSIWRFSFHS